jgi:hypothetical protein
LSRQSGCVGQSWTAGFAGGLFGGYLGFLPAPFRIVSLLLHELQLRLDRIASLAEELELRTDVLVFVIGRGCDLGEHQASSIEQ